MNSPTAVQILIEAVEAGRNAYENAIPKPMLVQQHSNALDDNSPVQKEWFVSEGVCGFAWINVPGNTWFIRELKKSGLASADINNFDRKISFKKDSYYTGYTYWVGGGQSYERKVAFANAFVVVLRKYDINAHMGSRLD